MRPTVFDPKPNHLPVLIQLVLCLLMAAGFNACDRSKDQLRLELQQSFRNYVLAIENGDRRGLETLAFFPGEQDYVQHVKSLILDYLSHAQNEGLIQFDPQGVVLSRFLGLNHHRYQIEAIQRPEGGTEATMHISVHFSYDNNIKHSSYEEGTTVLIPGKPWGKVEKILIGGENPIPREQLKYLEIHINFKQTNLEGFWQVRQCQVDPESIQYEISFEDQF